MATFTLSQKLLTAGAAALCSSTLLLMLNGNVVTLGCRSNRRGRIIIIRWR